MQIYFVEVAENSFFQMVPISYNDCSAYLVSFEGLLVDSIGVALCLCCLLVFLSLYRFSWSMLCRFRDDGISYLFINVSCLRLAQTLITLKLLDVGCQHEQVLLVSLIDGRRIFILNPVFHRDSLYTNPMRMSARNPFLRGEQIFLEISFFDTLKSHRIPFFDMLEDTMTT